MRHYPGKWEHNHWCKSTCLSKGVHKRNSRLVVCLELCYARERAGSGSYAWCLGGFTLFVRGNSTSSRDNYGLRVGFEEASLLPVSFYDFVKPFQGPFRWKWLMYFGPRRHLAARAGSPKIGNLCQFPFKGVQPELGLDFF